MTDRIDALEARLSRIETAIQELAEEDEWLQRIGQPKDFYVLQSTPMMRLRDKLREDAQEG